MENNTYITYIPSTELPTFRSSQRKFSIKKAVLKNLAIFAWKHLFWSLFLISCQSFKKETATQVLHRCKIFKNTYFQGYMYGRLFLYSRILKFFFEKWKNGKSKTRKSRKSWKSRKSYSEFSILPYSQNRKLRFEILGKKFPKVSEILTRPI